jgi:hypothetical protein
MLRGSSRSRSPQVQHSRLLASIRQARTHAGRTRGPPTAILLLRVARLATIDTLLLLHLLLLLLLLCLMSVTSPCWASDLRRGTRRLRWAAAVRRAAAAAAVQVHGHNDVKVEQAEARLGAQALGQGLQEPGGRAGHAVALRAGGDKGGGSLALGTKTFS